MAETISFTLNGNPVEVTTDGRRPLLWVLRSDLGLTGTKYGCGESFCGACTVLVDDRAVRACTYDVRYAAGRKVTTIEGLSRDGALHPLQQAFADHDALQCGFCTPGMILEAYSLLMQRPRPTREEIIRGLDRNLCRCGAHARIIDAVQAAAEAMEGSVSR